MNVRILTGVGTALLAIAIPVALADAETSQEIMIRSQYSFRVFGLHDGAMQSFASRYVPLMTTTPGETRISVPSSTSSVWYLEVLDHDITDDCLTTIASDLTPTAVPGLSVAFCTRITDDGVRGLLRLRKLRFLDLTGCSQLGDSTAKILGQIDSLNELRLTGIHISDEGIRALTSLHGLTALTLSEARISRVGYRDLGSLRKLSDLSIDDSTLDDDSIDGLLGLSDLSVLNLDGAKITNRGLEKLTSLPNLETLLVGNTGVTDGGMASILRMPSLKCLYIEGCRVSDIGLGSLSEACRLRLIYLQGTNVSEAGAQRFRNRCPMCRIDGLEFERPR